MLLKILKNLQCTGLPATITFFFLAPNVNNIQVKKLYPSQIILILILQSSTGQESKERPRPQGFGDQVLVLCSEKEFKDLTNSELESTSLLKYTIKRKVQQFKKSLPQAVQIMGFYFLRGGGFSRLSSLPPYLGLFSMPPGGKEEAQGHLSFLLALACFSCWGLTLEIKTGRGLSKG